MTKSIINRIFDGVLLIHRSKDRLERMDARLKALHIQYERISCQAVTTSSESVDTGSAQPHLQCWQHMLANNWESMLVLEDDAIFGADFEKRFLQAWLHVPHDWEQVYIGCRHRNQQHEFLEYLVSNWKLVTRNPQLGSSKHITVPHKPLLSYAYAIKAACAQKFLVNTTQLDTLGHIMSTIPVKTYAFADAKLIQASDTSNTASPYLGNALLHRIRTNRGLEFDRALSAPLFKVHTVNVGGWEIAFLCTGILAGYLTKRWLLCTALFILFLGLDTKMYGQQQTLDTHLFIFRTLCFTCGALLGSRLSVE